MTVRAAPVTLTNPPIERATPLMRVVFAARCCTLMIAISLLAACQSTPVNDGEPVSFAPVSVVVGDVVLHYVEHGDGVPIVLVHGSLADYSYWEWSEQIERLSQQYRVIAYSRRYNYPNNNEQQENHSPMVEARDLAGLIEVLELGPVHLVGHSYGAYTALVHAIEHPEQIRSLVLAEPPIISWLPDISGGAGVMEGFMAGVWKPLAQAFAEGGDSAGLEFTANWYFDLPWNQVAPEWQALFAKNVDEWRALAFSERAFPKIDYQEVGVLAAPTLLISAERNAGGFNDLVDARLDQLLPDSRRIVIANATHEMFLDDPVATSRAMLDFFNSQDNTSRLD